MVRRKNPSLGTTLIVIALIGVAGAVLYTPIKRSIRKIKQCREDLYLRGGDLLMMVSDPQNLDLLSVEELVALKNGDFVTVVAESSKHIPVYWDVPVRWESQHKNDLVRASLNINIPTCGAPHHVVAGNLVTHDDKDWKSTEEEAKSWRAKNDLRASGEVFPFGFRGPLVSPVFPSDLEK